MDRNPLKDYLVAIEASLKRGDATEHTHRPALKAMLEAVAGDPAVQAVNEPRRIACGAPDYVIARGTVPLGYVEAKDVGANLGEVERSEQLTRYRDSLGNLILTDYLEFRWYLGGELKLKASLPRPGRDGRIRWDDNAASEVRQLLDQFLAADIPLAASPAELATRMAKLAQLIRSLILQTFAAEGDTGELHAQREGFKRVLLDTLTTEQFADMYAQTLCYGLFAARCNAPAGGFTRQSAAGALPKTNPFLRRLFNSIAGPDLDDRIAWAVDQLALLLARADIAAILQDFGRRTRQEDPVVHFYETFLAAYDPKLRETRGVYYTPEPVVDYIVRSVDALLKRDFGIADGLAHAGKVRAKRIKAEPAKPGRTASGTVREVSEWAHRVQILDPACGTGTFLYRVIGLIRERFAGNAGAWPGYVAEHLLPRLFGFEILMAPYAVAHMKLGLELHDSGYDVGTDERLRVYLTNTLEEAHAHTNLPMFASFLAEEARAAADVKVEAPVMVVLGNPPYSGHSANKGRWIEALMADYKRSPELKKPAQAKWLSDDYVKFIRFAQWRIEATGYGVLAFVTNHGYLDNPTFLDMRASLMQSFDALYLLDLHGNSKKKEKAPGGGKDENVFDIQQGVAIGLFVRRERAEGASTMPCRVHHADLYGLRGHKYAWLAEHDVTSTPWVEVTPAAPARLFVPQDEAVRAEYERAWPLPAIFALNGDPVPGFATQHDDFAISWTRQEAIKKVERLLATQTEGEARAQFSLCAQDQWRYSRAKAELPLIDLWASALELDYRPFDQRWTIDNRNVLVHRRERITDQLLHKNLALVVPKNAESFGGIELGPYFVVSRPAELNLYRRGGAYLIALWLYACEADDLLDTTITEKHSNIAPAFLADLTAKLGHAPNPETILAYIYAILYAPSYRTRYAEFLKRDFPRVPLPREAGQFNALAALGQELIDLHTLQRALPAITRYPVAGSNRVDKVRWAPATDGATGRVYINSEQYFDGVPAAVWDTHIGGYRVAEKWLKDRKGRALSYDDLTHYQNVVAALARTLAIQADIDAEITSAVISPSSATCLEEDL